jgi:hypothetical protein
MSRILSFLECQNTDYFVIDTISKYLSLVPDTPTFVVKERKSNTFYLYRPVCYSTLTKSILAHGAIVPDIGKVTKNSYFGCLDKHVLTMYLQILKASPYYNKVLQFYVYNVIVDKLVAKISILFKVNTVTSRKRISII